MRAKDGNPVDASFWMLVHKKSFMGKIVKLKDEEKVAEEFKKKGITPTAENIEELGSLLNRACEKLKNCTKKEIEEIKNQYEEIDDDNLSAVAGGLLDNIGSTVTTNSNTFMNIFSNNTGIEQRLDSINDILSQINSGQKIRQEWLNKLAWLGGAAFVAILGVNIYNSIRSHIQANRNAELEKELLSVKAELEKQLAAQRSANIKVGVAVGVGAVALAGLYAPEIKAWFKKHC